MPGIIRDKVNDEDRTLVNLVNWGALLGGCQCCWDSLHFWVLALSPSTVPATHNLSAWHSAHPESSFSHCPLLLGNRGDRCAEKLRDLHKVMAKKCLSPDLEPDPWLWVLYSSPARICYCPLLASLGDSSGFLWGCLMYPSVSLCHVCTEVESWGFGSYLYL